MIFILILLKCDIIKNQFAYSIGASIYNVGANGKYAGKISGETINNLKKLEKYKIS